MNVERKIEKALNYKISYDVVKRIVDDNIIMYFLSSLVDINLVNEVIKGFIISKDKILNCAIECVDNIDEAISSINSGCLLIIYNKRLYIVETRSYPNRSISESDSEKSIKGSHDSFNESILTNTALLRRRINDENFRCELFKIGNKSKTDVTINYLDNITNKDLLYKIKKKLKSIDIDYLTLQEKQLAEILFNQKYQIFPKVRYTERADIASIHLLKGYILIIVDNSSSAIIVPTTFFELNEQIEEYQLPAIISSFNRLFRLFCILIGLYLLPIWYMLCIDNNHINNFLLIIDNVDKTHLFYQIITVSIFLNCIRLASIHVSSLLSTSLSLIASIILSDLAVKTGLVYPEVVYYCCLSLIACYCISNYETSRAITFYNLVFIVAVGIFGKIGFIIANIILFLSLVTMHTFDIFYLQPFIPFKLKSLISKIIKFPERKK